MKYFTTFAFVASLAGIAGMAACSSGSDSGAAGGAGSGNTSAGGAPEGGSPAGGSPAGGSPAGGAPAAGAPAAGAPAGGAATAGAGAGGAPAGGSPAGGAGAGGAGAGGTSGGGTAGTSGGGTAGTSGGGAGGMSGAAGGGSNAVVATCGAQMYTPTATPGAACATKLVPAAKLIADFEAAGVAPGWGVYPNDTGTGFTPSTATPSAGGANGTAKSLGFVVTALTKGIKIEVNFGTQCQDVRTFSGLSFWAKGTIDKYDPYTIPADTLVLYLGSEQTAQGGCTANCSTAPNDRRVTITSDWKEYRIPFNCFGDATSFDGYYTSILFSAFGASSNFAIDQVGYY